MRAPQYLQGIMTTSRRISLSLITGEALGGATWISVILLVTSGLPSTATTPLIAHVTFLSRLLVVAGPLMGRFMLNGKSCA
jgi:hypothetical protein